MRHATCAPASLELASGRGATKLICKALEMGCGAVRTSLGLVVLVAALLAPAAALAIPLAPMPRELVGEVYSDAYLTGVAASPDGKHVYAAVPFEGLRVYEQLSNGALNLIDTISANPRSVAMSPDGKHVYVGDNGINVYERDAGTGMLTFVELDAFGIHPSQRNLIISPDGAHVYAHTGNNGELWVFGRNAVSGELTLLQKVSQAEVPNIGSVDALALSPDGKHLYAMIAGPQELGFFGGVVFIFERDVTSGLLTYVDLYTDGGVNFRPESITVAPDGAHVYFGAIDGAVVFSRDAATGLLTFVQELPNVKVAYSVAVSHDGAYVYFGTPTLRTYARDVATGMLTPVDSQPIGSYGFLTVGPADEFVYTDPPFVVLRRDPGNGHLDPVEREGPGDSIDGLTEVSALALAPGDTQLYATGFVDDSVTVLSRDAGTGALAVQQVNRLTSDLDGPSAVVVSDDGAQVYATGEESSTLVAFDRDGATGDLAVLEIERNGAGGVTGMMGPRALRLSPDGQHVYVAARDSDSVVIFARDAGTGLLSYVDTVTDGVGGVAGLAGAEDVVVSPDGAHVYVVGKVAGAVVAFARDATTGALTFIAEYVWQYQVQAVAMSVDGSHVYAGGADIVQFDRDAATGELTFRPDVDVDRTPYLTTATTTEIVSAADGEQVYAVPSQVMHRDPTRDVLVYVADMPRDPDHVLTTLHGLAVTADGRNFYGGRGNQIHVFETFGCDATPRVGCRVSASPGNSKLVIKGERFVWKWKAKGEGTTTADFGDPSDHVTPYALCLWDESTGTPALAGSALAPSGRRWNGVVLKYRDKTARPQGLLRATLKGPKSPGKAVIKLKGRGPYVDMPAPPIALPIRAQLVNAQGECWEASFSAAGVRVNEPGQYLGLSDD